MKKMSIAILALIGLNVLQAGDVGVRGPAMLSPGLMAARRTEPGYFGTLAARLREEKPFQLQKPTTPEDCKKQYKTLEAKYNGLVKKYNDVIKFIEQERKRIQETIKKYEEGADAYLFQEVQELRNRNNALKVQLGYWLTVVDALRAAQRITGEYVLPAAKRVAGGVYSYFRPSVAQPSVVQPAELEGIDLGETIVGQMMQAPESEVSYVVTEPASELAISEGD